MSDLTSFITALEAAQNGAQYAPEVQKAAAGINTDDLKKAYAAAEAQGNKAQLEDPAMSAALKAGFEFAAKLVMELQSAPDNTEKTNLYVHYKIGNDVKVDKPGMFDLVVSIEFFLFLFLPIFIIQEVDWLMRFCDLTEEAPLQRLREGYHGRKHRPGLPGRLHQAGR